MNLVATVEVINLEGLIEYINTILYKSQSVYRNWAAIYRTQMQGRFLTRGDGEWAPLAASTIAKKTGDNKYNVLRDTDTLMNAVGMPSDTDDIVGWDYVEMKISSNIHPKGKGCTIAEIARFHQNGEGYLPKREIFVLPSPQNEQAMSDLQEKFLLTIASDGGIL